MTESSSSPHHPALPGWRDPAPLLQQTLAAWQDRGEALWIFGYASLLWKREFDAAEARDAQVPGWHRAFRMRSRVNRGSPECPGLVFALMAGGSCVGRVFRVAQTEAEAVLTALWEREMPTGVYDPRWLSCRTAQGNVRALAFTLPKSHASHTGHLSDEAMLHILRHAQGRYGTTLAYLAQTAQQLAEMGIRDAEVQRLMQLARRLDTPASPASA